MRHAKERGGHAFDPEAAPRGGSQGRIKRSRRTTAADHADSPWKVVAVMSKITTHVLDTVLGKPAAGLSIRLERREQELWSEVARGGTDGDGRCANLAPGATAGIYR